MQITIDTKHDSHDDIMKAIELLHHFTGKNQEESPSSSSLAQESTQQTSVMDMFSQPAQPVQEPEQTVDLSAMFAQETPIQQETATPQSPLAAQNAIPDTPPDFSSYLNLGRQEKRDDEPKVELF